MNTFGVFHRIMHNYLVLSYIFVFSIMSNNRKSRNNLKRTIETRSSISRKKSNDDFTDSDGSLFFFL